MDNCIFCKIATGEIPASFLYQDEHVVAFHDIKPIAETHFLIVPRRHIATLADANSDADRFLLGHMLQLASRLATQAGCGVSRDIHNALQGGFKTFFHVGPHGGQEIFHLHLHVTGGNKLK